MTVSSSMHENSEKLSEFNLVESANIQTSLRNIRISKISIYI